jgi:adenylate kinase
MQGQTFVFYGIIGSGKGTQVKFLADFLRTKIGNDPVCAGTGDGFRKMMSSDSFASQIVKEKVEKGELIDDFLANSMIADILTSSLSSEKNLITDGYPRTVAQSKAFEEMMKFFKRENIKIIYIKISEEESIRRNLLRGRHDDTEESIAKRIEEYKNNVVPSMEYFRDKNEYEILAINGEQSKEDVYKDIIKALNF